MAPTPSTRLLRASTLALSLALGLSVAACGGGEEKKAAEKSDAPGASGPTVTVAAAAMTNLPRIITASGSVTAWEEVPVGAETGGLVATAVYVDEGTYVRQGQPLVQLNDALLRAQLRQQQAGVQTAEANLARDDAALARAQELKERGFLSQASLDTALANQRAASANLASARAALSETQTRLSQATLRAPVSGLIISRSVTRGQIVQAGAEMFRMVRDGRLELDAQVPETELALIRAGQSATVSSDEVGQTTGRVRIVTPEVNADTRLGVARIALAGSGGFRPGMFAKAQIDVGAQPTITVPTASVLYRENRAGVYVLMTNNHVRFQPVTVLSRAEDRTSVAGVNAGTQVVVEGAGFLGDGDRVNVVAARPPAAAAAASTAPAAR
ncbi:efflux RND transporter periplasmic adaptor subunit [Brevundimonas sp. NIBR11]|uniref:efflux RND transporter periplasmic adaptor subunit n=1 Tax=Brevundimonas sp. NIBR11 TaxID=3015999 RepID=UPI0022EFF648|nr:efflux RND transporter periplasmic adaptor subunit [Brevundimonas sp. NIBR11]WGM32206.1 Multidrug resistance protein MdtA [Brevundimonas sp. NIBR11]